LHVQRISKTVITIHDQRQLDTVTDIADGFGNLGQVVRPISADPAA
jgi:hypothetical protein